LYELTNMIDCHLNRRERRFERKIGDLNMSRLSVVIPVYKAEKYLRELYSRLKDVLVNLSDDFEVFMVEDRGGDRSWDIIVELSMKDHRVKGIQLSRNFGQHNALLCGIRFAKGEIIVTMDDDLQHPPEEIPKLLSKLAEGYDVVYGSPQRERHGVWRNLSSRVVKPGLQASLGVEIASKVSAFYPFAST
jgi:glycosyltransferase involved in cell wall biosynthesis